MIWAYVLKAWGFVTKLPWQIYAAIGAALLLWYVYDMGHDAGEMECEGRYEEAARKALEAKMKADEAAAIDRQNDSEVNQENKDARDDAIRSDGRTGLNCQRLRSAGYREADLPEPCRR